MNDAKDELVNLVASWSPHAMRQEIERLKARVEELERERQWRPIESAPKDGSRALIAPDLTIAYWTPGYSDPDAWYVPGIGARYPTHWMPLPDPPTEGETE